MLIVFRNDTRELDKLLVFLNSLRPSIKFTGELESEGCLPFLDVLIKKSSGGLVFSVYRKLIHMDVYLNRSSCLSRLVVRSGRKGTPNLFHQGAR